MAELRKQALLASGVQIEGLQQAGSAPKKVVYGKKKKTTPGAKDGSPAPESRPRSPEPVQETPSPTPPPGGEEKPDESKEENGDVKSDWDASSDEEETKPAAPAGVKDSWDASSDEDEKKGMLSTVIFKMTGC